MSDNKIKVSVIVPCYNAEKFLHKCLDSLTGQTLKDIEIICVNDCAKDSTAAILEEYSKKDDRIKIITHEKNQGLSAARNSGIAAAKGDYIGFVDSDDFVELTMMEKLYNKAIQKNADLVIGNVYLYLADIDKTEVFRDERFFMYLAGQVFKFEDQPSLVSCIGAWDRIYKRELIIDNNLQFPVGMIYEDQPFSIQAMAHAERITVVSEPLYYYRKNAGGSITDNEIKNDNYKFQFVQIANMSKTFMKYKGIYETFQKEYLEYHIHYATIHQSNTKPKNFSKFFEMMREITSEEDYEVLLGLNLNLIQEKYVKALKDNDLNAACRTMKSYAFARKVKRAFKKSRKAGK
jgi:glycosyltransferase involved in cell wall biosynthesis